VVRQVAGDGPQDRGVRQPLRRAELAPQQDESNRIVIGLGLLEGLDGLPDCRHGRSFRRGGLRHGLSLGGPRRSM
jgi:hypothetical protein